MLLLEATILEPAAKQRLRDSVLTRAVGPSSVSFVQRSCLRANAVSDHTAGIIVTFTAVTGGSNVGTATTDASGLATLTFQPTIGSTRYSASAVHP